MAHEPLIDPRLGWIVGHSPEEMRIHQLGVLNPLTQDASHRIDAKGNLCRSTPRIGWKDGMLKRWAQSNAVGKAVAAEIAHFESLLRLNDAELAAAVNAPQGHDRVATFRWYLQYLLDTAATLVNEAQHMKGIAAIIATDTDTLITALLLKSMLGVPVYYDAHEYWPAADVEALPFETDFWIAFERRLLPHADYWQTVSPHLAEYLSQLYGLPFASLPNCEPLISKPAPAEENEDGRCRFLFLGGFAPSRGLDVLIELWPQTPGHAVLLLQGPDNSYKEKMKALARASGLLNTRIFFPAPVREEKLVETAATADVGIIPYMREVYAYRFCCPNKMSQYMAAARPILANGSDFVAYTVNKAQSGIVTDFTKPGTVLEAIRALAEDAQLREKLGNAGRRYFQQEFNWNACSATLYATLDEATRSRQQALRFTVPKIVHSETREWIRYYTVRPVVRAAYRRCMARRGVLYTIARAVFRSLPTPMRHYLILRAGS